ncbi:MAG: fibronectin type III domain-containing protein [Acidobacteriota bacterium]
MKNLSAKIFNTLVATMLLVAMAVQPTPAAITLQPIQTVTMKPGPSIEFTRFDPSPTLSQIQVLYNRKIVIYWYISSDVQRCFEIERRKEGETYYTRIGTTGVGATSYTDAYAVPNITYYYRVRGVRKDVTPSVYTYYSGEKPAMYEDKVPDMPMDFVACGDYLHTSIGWAQGKMDAESFHILRKDGPDDSWHECMYPVSALHWDASDFDVVPGHTYTYRMFARNCWGDSPMTDPITVTISTDTPPMAPSNLTATSVTSTEICLSWVDNSTNETKFRLYRGDSEGHKTTWDLAADTTSFADDTAAPGTTYTYEIWAINDLGKAQSNTVTTTTPTI